LGQDSLVVHRDVVMLYFFFFQAEDGIRDWSVTEVQTCALPIWLDEFFLRHGHDDLARLVFDEIGEREDRGVGRPADETDDDEKRSEERRVGKECRSRGAADQ